MPLPVLVNGRSASASEMLAAALQDHKRAIVVGEPTYGKGLMQVTWPEEYGAAVNVTNGRWRSPAGRHLTLGPKGAKLSPNIFVRPRKKGEGRDAAFEQAVSAIGGKPVPLSQAQFVSSRRP